MQIQFLTLQPDWLFWLLALGALTLLLLSRLRKTRRGVWLRLLASGLFILALAMPALERAEKEPLSDIVFLIVDRSPSQEIESRAEQTARAESAIKAHVAWLGEHATRTPIEIRTIHAKAREKGTDLLGPLALAAAEISPGRIAGAILVTDGQIIHDERFLPSQFPAPVHALITGRKDEYDRRLVLETEPGFGIVGEPLPLSARVEELGVRPADADAFAYVTLFVNGEAVAERRVTPGVPFALSPLLPRRGQNLIEIHLAPVASEITQVNNFASLNATGVRERLRVLLVSGAPTAGGRVWRNLLKSDPSVDLVHFTILRPPNKFSGTPLSSLSLIPFPTDELFREKLHEFDLVIFDRYRRRGILQNIYLQNIVDHVQGGGAALLSAGPELAGVDSLAHTPLAAILPAKPTGLVMEARFRPHLSEAGKRHAVTAPLAEENGAGRPDRWGRWLRQVELTDTQGVVLMEGAEDAPLVLLNRVGKGRVMMIGSDQFWLWARHFEGGGPSVELLRRAVHWLMKEPELEEEALSGAIDNGAILVERRSIAQEFSRATLKAPSGAERDAPFLQVSPGLWRAEFAPSEIGVHEISDNGKTNPMRARILVGPPSPKEFANPVSATAHLAPLVAQTGGALLRLTETGVPDVRRVREGTRAKGTLVNQQPWIGLFRRNASLERNPVLLPLLPAWLGLPFLLGALLGAWWREGR